MKAAGYIHILIVKNDFYFLYVQVYVYHQYDKIRAILNLSTEDARAYVASSTQPSIRQQTMQYLCK